jgi:hypothetical protein
LVHLVGIHPDGLRRHLVFRHSHPRKEEVVIATSADAPLTAAGLRELARQGILAGQASQTDDRCPSAFSAAAYEIVWPVVFGRLTRGLELRRGHPRCALGVAHLADDCLDRFQDDVEAVIEDLLAHANVPILNLEAWIVSRLTAATVDGHRRRRGRRGALQRPRVPAWLASALHHDPWLTALAVEILTWVGLNATAGSGVWPLDAWAQRRAQVTDDRRDSPAVVSYDVETVLAAMRRRPRWYQDYVERPLGAKQAPVAWELGTRPEDPAVAAPLMLAEPSDPDDERLVALAERALDEIDDRLGRGEDPTAVVTEVIGAVFGAAGLTGIDDYRHRVSRILADPGSLRRVVEAALDIVVPQRGRQLVQE